MKVYFDTNVYVAETLFGQAASALLEATAKAGWRIHTSSYLLAELERVMVERLGCSRRFAILTRRRVRRHAILLQVSLDQLADYIRAGTLGNQAVDGAVKRRQPPRLNGIESRQQFIGQVERANLHNSFFAISVIECKQRPVGTQATSPRPSSRSRTPGSRTRLARGRSRIP